MNSNAIQGTIVHKIGALCPEVGQPPKFAQIYFYDSEHELENRARWFEGIDKQLLESLQVEQVPI